MFHNLAKYRFAPVLYAALGIGLAGIAAAAEDASASLADLQPAAAGSSLPAFRSLESSGAVIARVSVTNNNVFDLEDPEENKALFRLANRLHAKTRESVIEQQLLFSPGDVFSLQALEETERLLRENRYLRSASVQPTLAPNGAVNVEVETADVWTLMPKIAFSRSGGANKAAIGIKETNLFGTGMAVELAHKVNIDRDSTSLKFVDRHLGKGWNSLSLLLAENSDGHRRFVQLERPFYSLTSESSGGFFYLDDDRVASFYDRGVMRSQYRHQARQAEAWRGYSHGLVKGYSRRVIVGLSRDEHEFAPYEKSELPGGAVPEDRKFLYPFIGFEVLEDRYEKASNVNQIGRIEDYYLGTHLQGRLGVAMRGAGSDRDALIVSASAATGFGRTDRSTLRLTAGFSTRLEDSGLENLSLALGGRYTRRQSAKSLLFVDLRASYGHQLDLDGLFELGGDSGLRGYPLRYQTGDRLAAITVEQRYFSDWNPFHLFRIGGAVFFDAGMVWGQPADSSVPAGLLTDVGFGLRLASDRSGFGRMTHIDLSFPLGGDQSIDSVQLLVSTKKSF